MIYLCPKKRKDNDPFKKQRKNIYAPQATWIGMQKLADIEGVSLSSYLSRMMDQELQKHYMSSKQSARLEAIVNQAIVNAFEELGIDLPEDFQTLSKEAKHLQAEDKVYQPQEEEALTPTNWDREPIDLPLPEEDTELLKKAGVFLEEDDEKGDEAS